MLRLQERPGLPLTSVEERLFTGLAAQAGLVLRLVGLRAELEARHDELVARAEELKASRERLIETQDAERRRLERDIHDGAQQHLVALTVNLRLAADGRRPLTGRAPPRCSPSRPTRRDVAIETLSSLSRGIYPRLLADEGLVPALRSAVATSAIPVTVERRATWDGSRRRSRRRCTSAAWRRCRTPPSTPARSTSTVRLSEDAGTVAAHRHRRRRRLRPAPAAQSTGAGLVNMRDRLDAVGGTVTVDVASGPGRRSPPWSAAGRPPLVDTGPDAGRLTCAPGSPGRSSA